MAVKQTAGREALGQFAPKFAQLNDDVLFGEVWSREDQLSLRDRSLVTVVALMSQGLVDSSFQYHLATARKNGSPPRIIVASSASVEYMKITMNTRLMISRIMLMMPLERMSDTELT